MRPIPKKLLIHTVELYKTVSEDKWGKGEQDAGTRLTYVRMEPSDRIVRDKNNAEIQLAATLFFDCTNSRPVDMRFCLDDIVTFNGEKYQIRTREPLYDEKRLHHYELGLVRYG